MVEKEIKVLLKAGLQARAAALFVQQSNRFQSEIFLEKDGKKINAKSIMGLMSLAVQGGASVKLIVDGADEQEALTVLEELVQSDET